MTRTRLLSFRAALLIALTLAAGEATAQGFSFVSPTGSSIWVAGSTETIQWTGGPAGTVDLYLIQQSPFVTYGAIVLGINNTGSHVWNIPASIPANTYQIYIQTPSQSSYGYSAFFVMDAATTTSRSTWGRLKQLYR